ncbi:molybdopterin-dependent oxidoreductase [Thermococcus sp.]
MKKELFALFVLILLILGTYGLKGQGGNSSTQSPVSKQRADFIEITGFVERPYNITYEELEALPSKSVTAELYCVDSPNLPRKSGTWIGVPLRVLLERAGVKEGAYKIAFYAEDGYTTDLYVEDVMNNKSIIVAYELNGKPIKPRLVVPGRWGYKWIKGLTKIRLVNYNFKGTWESAGYPDEAYIEGPTQRGAS